jgi:hypothetical protein
MRIGVRRYEKKLKGKNKKEKKSNTGDEVMRRM